MKTPSRNWSGYVYAAALILPRLPGFLLLPAYAAVLSLFDMGRLSTAWIFISLFQTVAGMGMTQALGRLFPLAEGPRQRREILTSTLLGTIGGGILTTLAALCLYAWPAVRGRVEFLDHIDGRLFAFLLGAGLLGNLASTLIVYFRAEQKAWSFLYAGLAGALVELGLAGTLLWFRHLTVANLLAVECAKQGATLLFIGWKGWEDLRPAFSRATWKSVSGFGFWLIPVGMCECVYMSADRFWLGQAVSMESVGIYGFFYKFATPLTVIFTGGLMDFHSRFYRMQGEAGLAFARERLGAFLNRGGMLTLLAAAAFPVAYMLLAAVFPVFPRAYLPGLRIFPLLAAVIFVFTWGKYFAAVLEYHFRTRAILLALGLTAVAAAALTPFIIRAGVAAGMDVLTGAAAASLVTALISLVLASRLSSVGPAVGPDAVGPAVASEAGPTATESLEGGRFSVGGLAWLKGLGILAGCLVCYLVLSRLS